MAISFSPYFPFSTSLEMILIIVLAIVSCVMLGMVMSLQKRIKRMLKGNTTTSIEDSLTKISSELQDLIEFRHGSEEYLTTVERRLRNSVQSVETLRFNAFRGSGSGGNQSFASAFLNENGDGLVISTLYSSDRMSIFAKPVTKFTPAFELTEEEKDVLDGAKNKLSK
ncbi:MAG: hypothetical protein RL094_595 [Candidatus Parcubacteria bacterium]|jgi:hypothetical protein